MWELDYKEIWAQKNWYFLTVVFEKTLKSPLDCKEIPPVHPKGNRPEYSSEGLTLKLKLQYLAHLIWRTDSLEKTMMLGKAEGRRRRGQQRMRWFDGITNAMDLSCWCWWWTGKPVVLQSLVLQRVGHDWTELNWPWRKSSKFQDKTPLFSISGLIGGHLIQLGLHFLSCKMKVNSTYLGL